MKIKQYLALLPAVVFLAVFALLSTVYNTNAIIQENSPIFAGIIAAIVSFFTFQKNETFNERINIFIKGSNQTTVIHMCYAFFLSAIFTAVLEHIGSIQSAINIWLRIIPISLILPGVFICASISAFIIGTSLGIITSFMPAGLIVAQQIGIHPSLMAATILTGAMLGDNLSILSDITIVSIKIAGTTMTQKLWLNLKIIIPAFLTTIGLLAYQNNIITMHMHMIDLGPIGFIDIIKALPYILTFYLVLKELDVIIAMVLGIMLALTIGVFLGEFTILTAINFLFDGFYIAKDMVCVFLLVVLLSGLSAIMIHNGASQVIYLKLRRSITNTQHAKRVICYLVGIINMTVAINSIAVMISGPIVKKLGRDFQLDPAETACILDITSCIFQGLLPYSPQLLLAASLAQVSVFSLLPYLYYQYFLTIALIGYITLNKN